MSPSSKNQHIKDFIQDRLDDALYRKDSPALYRRDWHPLFTYGTLKQRFPRHHLIEKDSCFLGYGFTRGSEWTMFKTMVKDQYPIVLPATALKSPSGTPFAAGHVQGEIYLVPPETISYLDQVEGEGFLYKRCYRLVDVYSQGVRKLMMPCYIYVGDVESWQPDIDKSSIGLCPSYHRKKDPSFMYYLYGRSA